MKSYLEAELNYRRVLVVDMTTVFSCVVYDIVERVELTYNNNNTTIYKVP